MPRRASTPAVPAHRSTRRWHSLALALGLLLLVFGVFGQIVGHDLVNWDDELHIVYNPQFNPVTLEHSLQFWREPYFGLYVPVSYSVLAAEAWAARLPTREDGLPRFDPSVFHAGSLVLHACGTLLVFVLLFKLLGKLWPAAVGAALFAIHPLQVESVAWASETRGLVAAMFSLLSLLAWLQFTDQPLRKPAPRAPRSITSRFAWYCLASAAFALAMLSKPSAAATPLLAGVLSLCWLGRPWRETLLGLAPWCGLVLVLAILTQRLQTESPMLFVPPLWSRPFLAADALQFYLLKLLMPWNLAAHYDKSPLAVIQQGALLYGWIVPALLLALVLWRRNRPLTTAAAWFLAALLPVLGLAPFAYQDYSTVADRYAYLAIVGPSLLLAAWLANSSRPDAKVLISLAVLAILAISSYRQAAHWRNTETLFLHNLAINPRSEVARDNYASHLLTQDRPAEALAKSDESLRFNPNSSIAQGNRAAALAALNRKGEALQAYRLAVACDPTRVQAHLQLADALAQAGLNQEAESHYHEAISLDPHALLARYNYGILLQKESRDAEALAQIEEVLRKQPDHYAARMLAGRLESRRGNFDAAANHFAYLVESSGDLTARVQLAEALVAQGKMDAAYAQYREALREPSSAWPRIAGRVAWLLATHPSADFRDGRQALQLALEANRLTGSVQPDLLRSLAAAYAETGNFDQATAQAEKALAALAPNDAVLKTQLEKEHQGYSRHATVRATPHPSG